MEIQRIQNGSDNIEQNQRTSFETLKLNTLLPESRQCGTGIRADKQMNELEKRGQE